MKKLTSSILLSIFFAGFLFAADNPEPKFKGWKKSQTQHFNFIYEDSSREAAENYISIADEAWNKIGKIYGYPQEKTNVYVTGRTNVVNALTFFTPPEIVMFNTPVMEPTFTFRTDWQNLFFTHELIHVANINYENRNSILPKITGPWIYNMDFANVNGWALEGLTTVLETELTEGGRGRSPYFELMYKAPTLDNGFISYSDIGKEQEPPYGQSYVMGYLIMRSIADRYGIQALADIERNRNLFGSWEESVKNVTGEKASDIYKDVRIALAKKYKDERKIPEGITISSRDTGTFYYQPAVIMEDGSLISLRNTRGTGTAVVKLNPAAKSGSNRIQNTNLQDPKTQFEETILFSGSFYDSNSVTADVNGNVYSILYTDNYSKAPGYATEVNLYKWNQTDGLKQLTYGKKIFQPAVSRDGSVLVAVEQTGMKLRLVKIDISTGEMSVLLENDKLSFIQPALNENGTKLAFLVIDGKQAKVAVKYIGDRDKSTEDYVIVANNGNDTINREPINSINGDRDNLSTLNDFSYNGDRDNLKNNLIFDPAYPNWTKDDSLTFCCNYRGRLEVFQVSTPSATENFNYFNETDFTINPVVSDPIGALWAYKTEKGIYYWSYASTGNVVKMLPVEQWGQTPDFPGPSAAGEIISFGQLETDFPEFTPFQKPPREKELKSRDEENLKKKQEAFNPVTKIENEKNYIPGIHPLFYIPAIDFIDNKIQDNMIFGFGALFAGTTPFLQMRRGVYLFDVLYYPTINNFAGEMAFTVPVSTLYIDLILHRDLYVQSEKTTEFVEYNYLYAGLSAPIIEKYFYKDSLKLNFATGISGSIKRTDSRIFKVADSVNTNYSLDGIAGLEFSRRKTNVYDNSNTIMASLFGITSYDFKDAKLFFGAESELEYNRSTEIYEYGGKISARYMPHTSTDVPRLSMLKYGGQTPNLSNPFIAIPNVYFSIKNFLISGTSIRGYVETALKSYSAENFSISAPDNYAAGLEYGIFMDQETISFGYCIIANSMDIDFTKGNFYFDVRINGFRF